ncbi:MAG: hypothetical protein AAGI88_00215 [Pseudomonadota bacterium]
MGRVRLISPANVAAIHDYPRLAQELCDPELEVTWYDRAALQEAPTSPARFDLLHSVTASASHLESILQGHEPRHSLLLQTIFPGAKRSLELGCPAAILADGYARWREDDNSIPEQSGIVLWPAAAERLGLRWQLELGNAVVTDNEIPFTEQLKRIIKDALSGPATSPQSR